MRTASIGSTDAYRGEELQWLNNLLDDPTYIPNLQRLDYQTLCCSVESAESGLVAAAWEMPGFSFVKRAKARGIDLELYLVD